MEKTTNELAEALREKARTSHDENVSSVISTLADTFEEIGLTALQGPAGPQGEQGATGAQGPSGPAHA